MAILIPGLVLVGLSWIAAWGSFGTLSELSFFPLWVGYTLTVNGISRLLFRVSLIDRMGWSFLLLFVISVPLWWFFEGMNAIVQNWHYHLPRPVSALRYFVEASIDFSTVVPAVLSTSFLLISVFARCNLAWRGWRPTVTTPGLVAFVLAGIGCYSLLPLFPSEAFPLVWIAPILVLEPVAYAVGFPSLLSDIERNGWTRTLAVMTATIITGFWWEMWNYYSLPKWSYTIPYVGFWKVFEMPLLGYLGYPFFGVVVFTYAGLTLMLLTKQNLIDIFALAAGRAEPR